MFRLRTRLILSLLASFLFALLIILGWKLMKGYCSENILQLKILRNLIGIVEIERGKHFLNIIGRIVFFDSPIVWIGLLIFIWSRSTKNFLNRLYIYLLFISGVVVIENIIFKFLYSSPNSYWINDIRLAPVFSFAKGIGLYSRFDGSFIQGFIYPPLSVFFYLPATLFSTPTSAILAGFMISFVSIIFSASILIISYFSSDKIYGHRFLLLLLFLLFLLLKSPGDWLEFPFYIGAEIVGAVFCNLACSVVYFRRKNKSRFSLCMMGLFLSFMVWSKQSFFLLLPTFIAYIYLTEGKEVVKELVFYSILFFLFLAFIFLFLFGFKDLFFNTVIIPMRHRLQSGLFKVIINELVVKNLFLWLAVSGYFLYRYILNLRTKGGLSGLLNDNPWLLCFFLTLSILPANFFERVKVGGGPTNFYISIYFLTLTLVLIIATLFKSIKGLEIIPKYIIICFMVFNIFMQLPFLYHFKRVYRYFRFNPENQAFSFAKSHKNEVLFPIAPLVTLISESRLYVSFPGISDLTEAGISVNSNSIMQNLPSKLKYIVIPKDMNVHFHLLKETSKDFNYIEIPEFSSKDWVVYKKID